LPTYLITVAGEIPLRSKKTRSRLYYRLIDNIRRRLARRNITLQVAKVIDAKILVETQVEALQELSRVFGVHRVSEVQVLEFRDLGELAKEIASRTIEHVRDRKFAVRVKRSGRHGFTSLDVAREVGALLKPYSKGVDLENPDIEVEVEVRGNKAYLYNNVAMGPGGLPLGSSGRALVLFSGSFDSPVAAWMIAKRGVEVDFLHYVMGSSEVSRQAFSVARKLSEEWLSSYNPRFITVDFTPLIAEIEERIEWSYRQVVLRALMYMVADKIATELGYNTIVTGEALSQASSQTLANLVAVESAVSPRSIILRPLIGFDKEEIIEYSRRIGLYDYSSRVAETCAIAPTHVVTRISSEKLKSLIERLDVRLVERMAGEYRVVDVFSASPEEAVPGYSEEIDSIPGDSIIIDVRSYEEYKRDALPGAIHLSMVDFNNLPRDKPVVLYCTTGGISLLLARELRGKGFKAYSLRGGLARYRAGLEKTR